MKKRTLILTIIMIIIMLTLIPITVYAWISYTNGVALVTVNSGFIDVSVKANDDLIINGELTEDNSLTYIDFTKDIVEDRSKSLNIIATTFKFKIENSENSLEVKNKIDLTSLDNQSLIYIVINEGKNILPNHEYVNDYYLHINNILGGETNETLQRQLIVSENLNVINTMQELILEEQETIAFQIVIWGDYDSYTGSNYLEETYLFNVLIQTIQADGVFS